MTGSGAVDANITEQIRAVLADHGRLEVDVASIAESDDLFRLGLTSHASVSLMLGLENAFDIEFPDEMLRKDVFESIAAIRTGVESLLPQRSEL